MSVVVIRCPNTNREVSTGESMSLRSAVYRLLRFLHYKRDDVPGSFFTSEGVLDDVADH
jgi:hypothetical protein